MNNINAITDLLQQSIATPKEKAAIFFKSGPGDYAEHDQFMGVPVPSLRLIAKQYLHLPLSEVQLLLESPINEMRLLALIILVNQYQKAEPNDKNNIYNFYLSNLKYVNNWNLVDASAHLIMGAHLFDTNKDILLKLAQSEVLWERRVAIVSSWHFIKNDDLEWTFKLSELLLNDKHDLIHKAVGWMLREAGKKDQDQLITFLNEFYKKMPRTMLRYSIEKFPQMQRKAYLKR